MSLDAIGTGNDQNRIVEHGEGSFHFRRKIDVPRSVKQGEGEVRRGDDRRFGEDGDASLPFHRVGVEKRVAMVDTAEFAYVARGIQQRFRQRGFAGVNMRQNAGDDSFHGSSRCRATAEAAAAYRYAKALTPADVRAWW